MFKRSLYILLFSLPFDILIAQTGGDNIYEFLNLTHSGLVSSLGGTNVSLNSDNLNLAYHNPALLNTGMDKNLALNYVNFFAGVNYGLVMYSRTDSSIGNFAAGLTYLNYGHLPKPTLPGLLQVPSPGQNIALSLIYSRMINSSFSVGINFKPILSHLEKYTSFGFSFDLGAGYISNSGLFSAGMAIKNAGLQVTPYEGEERQKLPFEINAGLTQKLSHAPFRFSLTIRHLEKFDLTYEYKDSTSINNYFLSSEFLENIMRHAILGIEFIPHKNFYLSGRI